MECKGWCVNDLNNGGGGQAGSVHLNPPSISVSGQRAGQSLHEDRSQSNDHTQWTVDSGQWTVDRYIPVCGDVRERTEDLINIHPEGQQSIYYPLVIPSLWGYSIH